MATKKKRQNSMFDASPMAGVFGMPSTQNQSQLSMPFEMAGSESYYLISLQRIVLTYAYTVFGPLRTLVDQPVYDSFRGGVKIKTEQLDQKEIELLEKEMKETGLLRATKNAMRWDRLFGGAGVIVNADQDFKTPLEVETISEDTKLEFIAADRWELAWNGVPGSDTAAFMYYSKLLHQSRVARIVGEDAPSLARQRLQGWGMSIIESVIREMNSYFKHQNVSFEILDEAKVDVWKIQGFNAAALQQAAGQKTAKRLQIANQMKSFLNAVVLDKNDDYEVKTQTFSGLAEILDQIRIGMAAAIRFPMSKIFGLAAKGWDSGETDLENYNAIVENERERAEDILNKLVPLLCHKLFGMVPDDIEYEWKSLRILKAVEEEDVKDRKFNRLTSLRSSGHLNPQEYMQALKEEGIFTMATEVGQGLVDPEENRVMVGLGEEPGADGVESESAPAGKATDGKEPSDGKNPKE